jgi:hypothetical protein
LGEKSSSGRRRASEQRELTYYSHKNHNREKVHKTKYFRESSFLAVVGADHVIIFVVYNILIFFGFEGLRSFNKEHSSQLPAIPPGSQVSGAIRTNVLVHARHTLYR